MNPRRQHHIFRPDGRTLICAMDHGMISGPDRGIENMAATLRRVIAGGVDAVMVSYGTARRFTEVLAPVGLVLRMDGAGTVLGTMDGPGAQFYAVEDALRLGADALCVTAFPASRHEEATLKTLAAVIRTAHGWGLPVMAEMVPGGFDSGPEHRTLERVALAARVAAELGADWVKVPYVPGFEYVVETCYVPVLVLGGAHRPDVAATLDMVQSAMQAGARGAVIGRNIWKAAEPTEVARALADIIHGRG
ncbi:MAG: deoxyribose-phosphate aldolase [Caldilineae bacterium]|nr:MAG: deoxyribose-phosphate aldolase [Caldilineae bacterium]